MVRRLWLGLWNVDEKSFLRPSNGCGRDVQPADDDPAVRSATLVVVLTLVDEVENPGRA